MQRSDEAVLASGHLLIQEIFTVGPAGYVKIWFSLQQLMWVLGLYHYIGAVAAYVGVDWNLCWCCSCIM